VARWKNWIPESPRDCGRIIERESLPRVERTNQLAPAELTRPQDEKAVRYESVAEIRATPSNHGCACGQRSGKVTRKAGGRSRRCTHAAPGVEDDAGM